MQRKAQPPRRTARLEETPKDLAHRTGLSLDTIRAALAVDGVPTLRTRCAIETALGQAIWSSDEEYQERRRVAQAIGISPETASLKELRQRARQLGVKGYATATNKPALAALILRELAAQKVREQELHRQMDAEL